MEPINFKQIIGVTIQIITEMLGKICIFLIGFFMACSYANQLIFTLFITLPINTIILIVWLVKLPISTVIKKLLFGQILTGTIWMLWLYFQQQDQLIYYLPLMISSLGKLYMLLSPSQNLDQNILEELIVFQSKLELGIFFYFLLEIIVRLEIIDIYTLIIFGLLGLVLKFKHGLHYATQKAYKQMHFSSDRVMKCLNLRSVYNVIYKILCFGGAVYTTDRIIGY